MPKQDDSCDAEEVLARAMAPPQFPIRPHELRGSWRFEMLAARAFELGRFRVSAAEVPHKGGRTLGYRVSDANSSLAYIPDHCPTALGAGPDGWGEYHPSVLALVEGVDLLVHDAHLLPEELAAEAAFGHAAADYAVSLGEVACARQVMLFHHKPERTDLALDQLGERLAAGTTLPVTVAAEEMVVDL